MGNTQSGLSVERETAIKILEELAVMIGNESFFDNAKHSKTADPDGEWYRYEDAVTDILLDGNPESCDNCPITCVFKRGSDVCKQLLAIKFEKKEAE